jgi:hypothetical protein
MGGRGGLVHNLKLIGFSVAIWANVSLALMLVNLVDL